MSRCLTGFKRRPTRSSRLQRESDLAWLRSDGFINLFMTLMISWIAPSWVPSCFSNSPKRAASSSFVASMARKRTNARTTKTLVSTALSEFSTVAAMMAPCSVKA